MLRRHGSAGAGIVHVPGSTRNAWRGIQRMPVLRAPPLRRGAFGSAPCEPREALPDAIKGFGGLHHATMGAGELATREKELIALGISVAVRCEPCIYAHVQAAVRF